MAREAGDDARGRKRKLGDEVATPSSLRSAGAEDEEDGSASPEIYCYGDGYDNTGSLPASGLLGVRTVVS
ncbi:hypothetical protein GUJ93_ZPchr0002g24757 [Zizania palustris]|uniref:Uncharacterized protein n=1 Tax=Zizania palustris TaxID=103762 RepID=A0A8J5VBI5_ZIZPA|nr:hypothetical protein GUJ93_ZPchr0002g24757 [Zizania palustris]